MFRNHRPLRRGGCQEEAICDLMFNRAVDQEPIRDFGEPVPRELELIEKSSSEQVLRFLQKTLTPTQKAALKKVIKETEPEGSYVSDGEGDEFWESDIESTLRVLAAKLTGELANDKDKVVTEPITTVIPQAIQELDQVHLELIKRFQNSIGESFRAGDSEITGNLVSAYVDLLNSTPSKMLLNNVPIKLLQQ